MNKIKLFSLLTLVALCACSPEHRLSKAKAAEKKEQYQRAWELYQEFAAQYPKHPAAPEAMFRAGWLAQKRLGDCVAAKAFYESVVTQYPQSTPWAARAAYFRNNCPDYFPLIKGFRWIEGDSETHGKNARIEVVCKSPVGKRAADYTGVLEKTFYAGESKFKTIPLHYKKTDQELTEYESDQDPRSKTVLMWPLSTDTKWITKFANKTFRYEIVAIDKTIKVQAGEFSNCVQVRSSVEGLSGATNEYYAPDVGRVLVTFSTGEGEKRNTELISYSAAEMDLDVKDAKDAKETK